MQYIECNLGDNVFFMHALNMTPLSPGVEKAKLQCACTEAMEQKEQKTALGKMQ